MADQSLRVGVIGAGRVGAVLGSALRAAGHEVIAVSARSAESLARVEALLPNVPTADPAAVAARADLVLVAVPDDSLEPVVREVAAAGGFRPGQLVVHMAGRHGPEVLDAAAQAGAITLAIHPAMTFSGTSLDLPALEGAPFAVTAAAPVAPIAHALVIDIGGVPVAVNSSDRARYHAALSHASNHLVTVLAEARELLIAVNIDNPGLYLTPLVTTSVQRALAQGDQALTGPLIRGDSATVRAHMRELRIDADATTGDTYRALAGSTIRRSLVRHALDVETAAELIDALDGRPETPAESGRVVHTRADLKTALRPVRTAVVMTMGALHEGHLALVDYARMHAEQVVVTIFVNPLQFGEGEDFDAYPRTLEADLTALESRGGVDVVYAPTVAEMYPAGPPGIQVGSGPVGDIFEGAIRPGHFDGVLTVVHKFLSQIQPDVAVFGQKDAQQLALIRQMVQDLDLGVQIVSAPIVREADGLARSSRNAYLSEIERRRARVIPQAVFAGLDATADPATTARDVVEIVTEELQRKIEVDYVAVVDPETFERKDDPGEALLIVAARVGKTRLLDNAPLTLG